MASSKLDVNSTVSMPNGMGQMQRIGFGVYQSPRDVCVNSCLTALRCGYRHIDSAQYYANEAEVGDAVAQSGIPRSELFLTTKMLSPAGDVDSTYEKIVESVKKMSPGTSDEKAYVDLFLIHSPNSGSEGRKTLWLALERAYKEGICKAIGVSNFGVNHIKELKEYASVWPPAVNQIELHPWTQQPKITKYCSEMKPTPIVIQAYCPIARNTHADDPEIKKIADHHDKTPNQVLIRYSLQRGWVPLPKSDNAGRIKENVSVFDFELSDADMQTLNGLDQGSRGACVQVVEGEP